MKRIITLAGIGLFGLGTLAACSDKVDREGSIDNFVDELEAAGLDPDRACLEDVLEKYNDDELNDLREEFEDLQSGDEPSDEAAAFSQELIACGTGTGEG